MLPIKKIISYPISVIFYVAFIIVLLVFHIIQWIALKFGYLPHKLSVDWLNFMLLRVLNLLGTSITFKNQQNIETTKPCIFVANHQSMFDIPPLIWFLRKHHPKFVSKIELSKGIPSISFNLKHGGSVLINRTNSEQAMKALLGFSEYLKTNNRSAVIFPEGTRSKTGLPKKFNKKGLAFLMEQIPEAQIVPITINNTWKIFKNGNFPLNIGVPISFTVHKPIVRKNKTPIEIVDETEKIICETIK